MDILAFFLDPDVIYIVLVAALWAVVTAVHLPGTGIIEAIAIGAVIGVVVLLMGKPTNWVSVVLIVLGVLMFLILPLMDRRFVLIGLLGLVMQGVGGWFLFNGEQVSMAIIGVTLIVSLLYYRFALIPALETQKAGPQMLDDQPIIGMKGRVQTPINPVGTVYVQGETWTARRGDNLTEAIEPGTEIIVRDRDGLTLFVEPLKPKREIVE